MSTIEKAKVVAAPKEKKRTIYSPKGMLDLPQWAKDDKEHRYRWVSKRRLPRSDGYDPRGWSAAHDPDGKVLEASDVILSRMPLDEWEAMMDYKKGLTRSSIKTVMEGIEAQSDRLRYEVQKMGGKMDKTDFSIERKI